MTALTHSDVSKVSNADVKLCNDVTKCPIAPLIQLQQVAHSQPVRRRGIPRQPLPSLVAGSNQHRSSSLTSVTVQVCRVSQCTPWRHTTCCSSRWPCSQQHGRLPDRTGKSVSMPRAVRDRMVGTGPAATYVHSGSGATQPPTE